MKIHITRNFRSTYYGYERQRGKEPGGNWLQVWIGSPYHYRWWAIWIDIIFN